MRSKKVKGSGKGYGSSHRSSQSRSKAAQGDPPPTLSYWDIPRINRWAGPILIVAVTLAMLWWSWGKWPDPVVDFGQQLYMAWQLAEGSVLYTDVMYIHGPLSQYLNSVWFRLFGASLRTLAICNIAVLFCLIYMLYRILTSISDRLSATIACLIFVTIFAFGQLVEIGNYNFVCPYAHENTHGLILSIVAIACLSIYYQRRRLIYIAGAGFALGLVLLTKAEIILAACLTMTACLGFTIWAERPARQRVISLLGVFAGCAAVPSAVSFALLCLAMPANHALQGTLGTWRHVFSGLHSGMITSQSFYRWQMGTLNTAVSLKTMLVWMGWYLLAFLPPAVLGLVLRKPGRCRIGIASAVFVLVATVLGLNRSTISWFDAPRPLPLIMLALGVVWFVTFLRRCRDSQASAADILRLTMIFFAFTLLAKMILNVRVYHYGFTLAMPAALLLVVTLVSWVPAYLTRLGGYGGVFRAAALAILMVVTLQNLEKVNARFSRKTYTVSKGQNAFLAGARGGAVDLVLSQIEQRVAAENTLAVFPEGVMLNFLSKRINPTPYTNFMPTSLARYGEQRILASYQAHPPDYVALVHKDTSGFGFRFFGRDYGQRIYSWIQKNYHSVVLIGNMPLQDRRFGILLLKRVEGKRTLE